MEHTDPGEAGRISIARSPAQLRCSRSWAAKTVGIVCLLSRPNSIEGARPGASCSTPCRSDQAKPSGRGSREALSSCMLTLFHRKARTSRLKLLSGPSERRARRLDPLEAEQPRQQGQARVWLRRRTAGARGRPIDLSSASTSGRLVEQLLRRGHAWPLDVSLAPDVPTLCRSSRTRRKPPRGDGTRGPTVVDGDRRRRSRRRRFGSTWICRSICCRTL